MRRFVTILAAFVLCSCGGGHKAESDVTPPPLLIDQRGTTMPLEKVVTHLSFRPFMPSAQVLAYAVLPPIGGLDTDQTRGIGIEYMAGSNAMLLSQWPKGNFNIAFGHGGLANCAPVHYSAQALAWTTRRNVLMTLQPDGSIPPAAVEAEARRLIRDGACR